MITAYYISVILPLKLDWEPCYSLPDSVKAADVEVGSRVRVTFANRSYSAVVSAVGITPDTDSKKIKPISSLEEGMSPVLKEEIALWRNVSDYYLCSIGEVYKAAYPIGKINLEESHAAALMRAESRREKILASMRQKVERLQNRLTIKREQLVKLRHGTKARAKLELDLTKIKEELHTAENALKSAESNHGLTGNDHKDANTAAPKIKLSKAQADAYDQIRKAVKAGSPAMLHGVTGSGKTEIYIKLAQETLRKGRNVLCLVPEIALSRQLEERLAEHFGDRLMTYHSGETAVSRLNTAEKIRSYKTSGEQYIILGTRSALFLPHHGLGLIVVDEEHDGSYKQDSPAPRYNGRDTALMLSVIHGSGIVLGSATPSLEEIYNCRIGRHVLVQLNERYHGSVEPEMELIDTKAERKKNGMVGSFSRKLIAHMESTIKGGGQVMILRSRRSWAPALQCEECGEIQKCPHCNVSLSFHKAEGASMTCHYCGCKAVYTGKCAKCQGNLKSLGAGTQKIEEEAAALFPDASIARLDSDTAQSRNYESKVIKDFSEGRIDILIGTQMVTKGFDFSNLRLVAVISADSLLGMQDFRADEKAVQMLSQFRGRCGRRGEKGLFVIQTSQPEHPVYSKMSEADVSELAAGLLDERRDFNFPPFTRIVEITFKDISEKRCNKMSRILADSLCRKFASPGRGLLDSPVTGPYAPAVDKIADNHVRVIRLSLKKDRQLTSNKTALKQIIASFEKEYKYDGHISVNVDPY